MKEGGQTLWIAIAICEMSKEQPYEIIRFHPTIRRKLINMARKFCQEYSSDMHQSRGEFGKEIFWLQTLRHWKRWTHQIFHPRMQKEVLTPQRRETFHLPSCRFHSKIVKKRPVDFENALWGGNNLQGVRDLSRDSSRIGRVSTGRTNR